MKRKTFIISTGIIVLLFGLAVLLNKVYYLDGVNATNPKTEQSNKGNNENKEEKPKDSTSTENEVKKDIQIKLTAVGDMMFHSPQNNGAWDVNKQEYYFEDNFQYIKDHLTRGDITFGNLETTLAGNAYPYRGYPKFNSPDAVIKAMKYAGFDILSTANNHSYDTGIDGIKRTVKTIKKYGLKNVGTYENSNTKRYIIEDVEGIKVGINSYTYETQPGPGTSLNGLPMNKDAEKLVNTFQETELQENILQIRDQIQQMRAAGAEVIVFYVHWGIEYQRDPNEIQQKFAQMLVDEGVDIIFGSHPHVVQKIEYLKNSNNNKSSLVVYSMGNFLSNQRRELLNKKYTEDGLIVNVDLVKDGKTGEVSIKGTTYTPTWVQVRTENGKRKYYVQPVEKALQETKKYGLVLQSDIQKANEALENTSNLIGEIEEKGLPTLRRKR